MSRYIQRVTTAGSILINVIFGGRSNQTFSATQYQRKKDGKANIVWLIDKFFWWEADHCLGAWVKWKIIHTAIRHYDKLGEYFYDIQVKQYYEMVDDDFDNKRIGPKSYEDVYRILSRTTEH